MTISKKRFLLFIFLQLLECNKTVHAHVLLDIQPIITVDQLLSQLNQQQPTCIVLSTEHCSFCTMLKNNLPAIAAKYPSVSFFIVKQNTRQIVNSPSVLNFLQEKQFKIPGYPSIMFVSKNYFNKQIGGDIKTLEKNLKTLLKS
ncbi:hypothetical protein KBD08_00115 [Candidatus Babeliales bacterium]|nr:hypothetical protein [Candidatus Babeliales bacterium]